MHVATLKATQAAEGVPVVFTQLGSATRASRDRAETLAISPGGGLLACQGADKVLEIFALRTEEEVVKRLARRSKRVREKAKAKAKGASGDGEREGEGEGQDGASSDEVVKRLDDECQSIGTIRFGAKLRGFAFAPPAGSAKVGPTHRDCKLAVSLSNNAVETHAIKASNKAMESEQLLSIERAGHRTPCRAVAISHDDSLIISTSNSGAKVWDRDTQKCVRTLKAGYGLCTAFVPGNRHAIVGTRSGELQLFDLGSGEMIEELEDAHESAIWSLVRCASSN
jgi:U3 small nucleolar RNA-associated protein 12